MTKQNKDHRKHHHHHHHSAAAATSSSSSSSSKKKNSKNAVLAATAGLDSWKTWAGRKSGSDSFQWSDLFGGTKREFQRRFVWTKPRPGTACPICYCEPETPSQWHVTESCGHAVCVPCLRAYSANQVQNPALTGALRCPVCPLPLRRKDAVVALGESPDVLHQWDIKLRNQLLRALPSYRPCPHCLYHNVNDNVNDGALAVAGGGGGGFVTPECMQTRHNEREEEARLTLLVGLLSSTALLVAVYFVYAQYIHKNPSLSIPLDMVAILVPFPVGCKAARIVFGVVARSTQRILNRPVPVTCPCCDREFVLSASSEFYEGTAAGGRNSDKETQAWIETNTRRCPSCSAPITKTGGCNHMQCSQCKVHFCWACMRVSHRCEAYRCVNGARYGDASPVDDAVEALNDIWTVHDTVRRLIERAGSVHWSWSIDILPLLSVFVARMWLSSPTPATKYSSSHGTPFPTFETTPMPSASRLLAVRSFHTLLYSCAWAVVVYHAIAYGLRRWAERQDARRRRRRHELAIQALRLSEEEMVRMAIRNSRLDR